MVKVVKKESIKRKGKEKELTFELLVPTNKGVRTVATSARRSVGVGRDHTMKRRIEDMMSSGDRRLMLLTQVMEDNSPSLSKKVESVAGKSFERRQGSNYCVTYKTVQTVSM